MIDSRTWLVWTLLTMVLAVLNRNPLVAIVVLLIALAVESGGRANQSRQLPFSPMRIAGVVIVVSSVYNGIAVHVGNTVLFQLPRWLPYLGGPVTLEALVFGASNGLTLAVIFTIFAVFNQMTATHDLIGLMPRGLHDIGVVVSIALTFIPQTTASIARISEAQAIRGHRVRGPRDWLPIVVPLVVQGLEQSMGLAEAMVARGYGSVADQRSTLRLQGLLALGLVAVLGGWVALIFAPGLRWPGLVVVLGGIGCIAVALYLVGRAVPHRAYRDRRWGPADFLPLLGCGLTLALAILPSLLLNSTVLDYSPYPALALPAFDPLTGLGLIGLLAPVVRVR